MKDLRRLTLEEKVGQLFFLGFQKAAPDSDTQALMDEVRPGGIIFFQRNIETLDQIYAVASQLRESHGMPAFLAVDHEGGRVDRLKHLFAPLPSMKELAGFGTGHFRAGARIIAAELEAVGMNLNLAPVLDLAYPETIMADRSLATAPMEVSRLGSAFVEELSRKNIISCAKHFPGLGAATFDPHFVLPRIDKPKRQLLQEDVVPFMNLIDEVGMMMVSHAHYPGLGDDRSLPASLSSRVIDGFLRKKLGFQGVVVTDDLTMGAVTSMGLTPALFVRAFEAGNDLLLFSQTTPLVLDGFQALVRAVRSSEAMRLRLDESVARILRLKHRIQYSPVRYRVHIKARINRQIEKLRSAVETISHNVR